MGSLRELDDASEKRIKDEEREEWKLVVKIRKAENKGDKKKAKKLRSKLKDLRG